MYTIYSTTKGKRVCIYNGFVSDSRIKLIDPELELSGNNPGSLTFSIPPNHITYDDYDMVELETVYGGDDQYVPKKSDPTCLLKGIVTDIDIFEDWDLQPYVGDTYGIAQRPPAAELVMDPNYPNESDGHWQLASGVQWRDIYQSYYTINVYQSVSSETPADWEAHYFDRYYERKVETIPDPSNPGETIDKVYYSLIPADEQPPEYISGKYYCAASWSPAAGTFNSYNVYRKLDSTKASSFMVYGFEDMVLLTDDEAPGDWTTRYAIDYFYKDIDNVFRKIPAAAEPPEYVKNKYYVRLWSYVPDNVTVYRENAYKLNLVERMVSVITVYRMDTTEAGVRKENEIWSGRVVGEEIDWNGCRKITCEGAFGYLNDTLQPQKVYSNVGLRRYIINLLNQHNAKASLDHQFLIGRVENVVNNDPTAIPNDENDIKIGKWTTNYGSTMEALSDLVTKYGGYFRVDPPSSIGQPHKLSYICDPLKTITNEEAAKADLVASKRVASLGKNLMDFTKKWDMASLVTSIIPAGGNKDKEDTPANTAITGSTVNGQVLAPKTKYSYTVVTGGEPANWSTTYYNYYIKSDTTSTGFKKVAKTKKKVPTYSSGTYYTRNENTSASILACTANNSYRIGTFTLTGGDGITAATPYYITTTIDKGHYAYVIYDKNGNIVGNSSKASATTAYNEKKVTAPVGSKTIKICCYGSSATLGLKKEEQNPEAVDDEFDKKYRITDYNDDGEWHSKGSPYISNPDLVKEYGYIERAVSFENVVKNDTSESDDSVVSRLYAEAKKYLQSTQFDKMSMEVEIADLRVMGVAYKGIDLYDLIYVVSKPHGLDKIFPVTQITIPIAHPEEEKIKLGYESDSTISGVSVSTSSGLRADVKAIPSTSTTLKEAKDRAKDLIFNDTQKGVVRFVQAGSGAGMPGPEGTVAAIDIVNSLSTGATDHVGKWRWSYGGFGFFESSNGGETWTGPAVAMTNDGQIVADMITTGNLNAERITCGALTLGGDNSQLPAGEEPTHMRILNNSNQLLATADSNGYLSFGTWASNRAQYTKIDAGYLTAGEATIDPATGEITSRNQYGFIYPNYNPGNNTHNVALVASYGGSSEGQANNGRLYIAAKEIVVTRNYLNSGDLQTGSSTSIEVITSCQASVSGRVVTLNFATQKMSFVNGIFVGYTSGGGVRVDFRIDE